MTTVESAKNLDRTLYCAYFGGPRDGWKSGDLPAALSGHKLTKMVMKTALSQPAQFSLFAVYECTSETQIDGFWQFEYRGLEGPNGERLVAAEPTRSNSDRLDRPNHELAARPETKYAAANPSINGVDND